MDDRAPDGVRGAPGKGSLYILLTALLVGSLWRGAYFPTPPDGFDFPGSLLTPRWSLVALLLLAGAWELGVLAVERRFQVFRSPLLVLFAAFTAISGATYLWSETPAVTIKDFLLLLAFMSILLVVRGQLLRSGQTAGMIARWLVYTGAFVSSWAIITYILRLSPYANVVADSYLVAGGSFRAGGTFEYSNALGCFALMALPFTAALLDRDSDEDRLLLGAGMTLMTAAILLSLSRSAIALLILLSVYLLRQSRGRTGFVLILSSLASGVLVAAVSAQATGSGWPVAGIILVVSLLLISLLGQFWLLRAGYVRMRRIAAIAGGGTVLLIAILLATSGRAGGISERFSKGFDVEHSHRLDTWAGAFDAFRDRPIKGWGLGSFPQVYRDYSFTSYTKYAHNLVLQTAVDSGTGGAFLMALFLIYVTGLGVWRLARHGDPLVRAAAIAALVFILVNMFDWEWYVPALAAWFLALAALLEQGASTPAEEAQRSVDQQVGGQEHDIDDADDAVHGHEGRIDA